VLIHLNGDAACRFVVGTSFFGGFLGFRGAGSLGLFRGLFAVCLEVKLVLSGRVLFWW